MAFVVLTGYATKRQPMYLYLRALTRMGLLTIHVCCVESVAFILSLWQLLWREQLAMELWRWKIGIDRNGVDSACSYSLEADIEFCCVDCLASDTRTFVMAGKTDVRNNIFDQLLSVEGSCQHGNIAAGKPPVANVSMGASSVSGQRNLPLGLRSNTGDIWQHGIPSHPLAFRGSCVQEADSNPGSNGDSNGLNLENFSIQPENA